MVVDDQLGTPVEQRPQDGGLGEQDQPEGADPRPGASMSEMAITIPSQMKGTASWTMSRSLVMSGRVLSPWR
ncbi:hypothetical protein [Micromonospora coerulea]|uniref:hypothetical protein n=1 Tax=Micromonospora coerulea TaxID=47856 RepID=UPI00190785B4|nr:hypothetical protein [Micromonospora veneta]